MDINDDVEFLKDSFQTVLKCDKKIIRNVLESLLCKFKNMGEYLYQKMYGYQHLFILLMVSQNCCNWQETIFISDQKERDENLAELVERLFSQFPNDNGILMVYFLNYLKLKPSEAVFLAANEPHAYISGGQYDWLNKTFNSCSEFYALQTVLKIWLAQTTLYELAWLQNLST